MKKIKQVGQTLIEMALALAIIAACIALVVIAVSTACKSGLVEQCFKPGYMYAGFLFSRGLLNRLAKYIEPILIVLIAVLIVAIILGLLF